MRHMAKKANSSPVRAVAPNPPLRPPDRVYTPSQYPVRAAQEEAREIPYRNRERVKNEVLPREAETLRNRWSAPLFEIWRGTKVHKQKQGVEENPMPWVGSGVMLGPKMLPKGVFSSRPPAKGTASLPAAVWHPRQPADRAT